MNKPLLISAVLALAAGLFVGCESSLRPLQEVRIIEVWEPLPENTSAPATAASTEPSTQSAASQPTTDPAATQLAVSDDVPTTEPSTAPATQAATAPASQPGRWVKKIIDPNRTSRFVYRANYDRVWQQSLLLLTNAGFTLDRKDYRHGTLTTRYLPSPQIVEPWKRDNTTAKNAMENTINSQRRTATLTIKTVEGKPEFFEISIQILVERQTNPVEVIGGLLFTSGSGFGASGVTLRSDFADIKDSAPAWVIIGHDPALENKLIKALFEKI